MTTPSGYPPSRANVRTTSLPIALTSFVGRDRELREVAQLVASESLVTLTGAGGCGKTRLALQIAAHVSSDYPQGLYWVDLAPLADPALVPHAVALALNVAEQPGRALIQVLAEHLRAMRALLVMDNCEHLASACAELVAAVLASALSVQILATSRVPLGVEGESLYPVSPLSLPLRTASYSSQAAPPADLPRYDAIRLFVERARAILPDFTLTPNNATAILDICQHLDGIPLAIELASARVNVLTVEQINARLDDRFALLTSAGRGTLSHHHTLRAAIDWSYDLLSADEQMLLRRLSVFAAGCTLNVAETVCGEDPISSAQVLDLLSSLVNKSLVGAETLQRGEARYRLLETIREYAREKLNQSGEATHLRDRYLQRFVELAEETVPKLRGPYEQLWLNWIEGEHDNFRALLNWALESHRIEAGLRIAVALEGFWQRRGYVQEGRDWFERLLADSDEGVPVVVRASAHAYAGLAARLLGDSAATFAHAQNAMALSESAGDTGKPMLGLALMDMGGGALAAGDYTTAERLLGRSVQLFREVGDRFSVAWSLSVQAIANLLLGKSATARLLLDEGLAIARELDNRYLIAQTLNILGDVARGEKDYARAEGDYEESLLHFRELGAQRDVAGGLHNLAHTLLHQGKAERAHDLFRESLTIQLGEGNREGVAECLTGLAAIAVVRGLPAPAARLLAAALSLSGKGPEGMWPAERVEYEYYLAAVRAQLSDEEFERAQGEGRTLSKEQAIEYGQTLPLGRSPTAQENRGGLTTRERQVAALISQGRSNSEIAETLVLSKRTVEKHIANILSKLNLTSRAQIVRWAMEREKDPSN